MLEKVVETLLSKFLRTYTPEQKAERRIKQKIVFVHEALVHCHNAYFQYKSDSSDEHFIVWRRAVGYLIRVLEDVCTTLASFAPDAYFHAVVYAKLEIEDREDEIEDNMPLEARHDLLKDEVEEESKELELVLEKLKRLQERIPGKLGADFKEATSRLRKFMANNMTMGEIHEAQKAFAKEILP